MGASNKLYLELLERDRLREIRHQPIDYLRELAYIEGFRSPKKLIKTKTKVK